MTPCSGNTKRGKYHRTVDLLFDWFGISCMTTDNFCFYLQNRLIQNSQTGGQRNSDTSPFGIPCLVHHCCVNWRFGFKSQAQDPTSTLSLTNSKLQNFPSPKKSSFIFFSFKPNLSLTGDLLRQIFSICSSRSIFKKLYFLHNLNEPK